MKIGFLDSGIGGLTVLNEAIKRIPDHEYLYYADSDHAPYGTRSTEEIIELTDAAVSFLIQKGAEIIVVACNTATSAAIRGVIIPAGVSSVYDQALGKNLKRPFLHVRYRASQTDDRRMKTWVTGSVGAATSALDAMSLHMLSERCLITQGANNFMLMK